jgi:hypothetical protein
VAALIDDARRRQRRRRLGLAAAGVMMCAGLAIGLAFATFGGGKSTSAPPASGVSRVRPVHVEFVTPDKVVVLVSHDTGRILRLWCARGATVGAQMWIARRDTLAPPAGPPPRCPS